MVVGILLAVGLCISDFTSLFHIEGGFSFIVVLQGLKFLEAKNKRDLFIVYYMLFLVTCAQVIFIQGLLSTFTSLFSLLLIFIGINLRENESLKLPSITQFFSLQNIKYLFFSGAIVLLFFLFFPRFEIGFLRFNAKLSKSGFSPEARPGTSDRLELSDEVVFKVKFAENKMIDRNQLYWVGSVLTKTDGYHWVIDKSRKMANPRFVKNSPTRIDYTLYSQQMIQNYLFSLDHIAAYPSLNLPFQYIAPKTFKLRRSYTQKINYSLAANFVADKTLDKSYNYLAYPKKLEQEALLIELVKRFKDRQPKKIIENILNYFSSSGFVYTLSPGKSKSLSEFLKNKKGFCSHFASAFAILARMSHIPSRVVVGHQGGEYNEFDGVLTVKAKDAHAWSEVYLEGVGWQRIDPVGSVQPARILYGGQEFFNNRDDILGGKYRKINHLWKRMAAMFAVLDHQWVQFMFNFNTQFQQKFARKLNIGLEHLYRMSILTPLFLLILLALFNGFKNRVKQQKNELLDAYKLLCQKISKDGPVRKINEDPCIYKRRVIHAYPQQTKIIDSLFEEYITLTYRKNIQKKSSLSFLKRVKNFHLQS